MIVTCDQSGQEIRVNTQDLNPGLVSKSICLGTSMRACMSVPASRSAHQRPSRPRQVGS